MALFTYVDDPLIGPRLRSAGITDDDLVRYLVSRANGASKHDAFARLLQGKDLPNIADLAIIRRLLEEMPIPSGQSG